MEEAPENGKELSHSAHANGMNDFHFSNKISIRKWLNIQVATITGTLGLKVHTAVAS